MGIFVWINTGPATLLLSWQRHDWCHFVSFMVYVSSGAKFKEHRFNISRDILD